VKGDVKIEILVKNFIAANEWAKGGLMIRETLDPGSKHFSLTLSGTGDKGLRLYWRESTSGSSQNPYPAPDQPAPVQDRNIWLRIVKTGNQFQAYYKKVGTTSWVNAGGSKMIQFSNDFYVGIAVTSHDNGQKATLIASSGTFTIDSSASIESTTCLPSINDPEIAKTAMNRCDESMALLVGSQTSLGTLKAIADLVTAEGPERMPGNCCFDTPTSNDQYLGVNVRQFVFSFLFRTDEKLINVFHIICDFKVRSQNHDMQE
jgi:hypothetical protein